MKLVAEGCTLPDSGGASPRPSVPPRHGPRDNHRFEDNSGRHGRDGLACRPNLEHRQWGDGPRGRVPIGQVEAHRAQVVLLGYQAAYGRRARGQAIGLGGAPTEVQSPAFPAV
jgi:hypothetical protein